MTHKMDRLEQEVEYNIQTVRCRQNLLRCCTQQSCLQGPGEDGGECGGGGLRQTVAVQWQQQGEEVSCNNNYNNNKDNYSYNHNIDCNHPYNNSNDNNNNDSNNKCWSSCHR